MNTGPCRALIPSKICRSISVNFFFFLFFFLIRYTYRMCFMKNGDQIAKRGGTTSLGYVWYICGVSID